MTTQPTLSSGIKTLDMEQLRKTLDREELRTTSAGQHRRCSSMSTGSESFPSTNEKPNKPHKLHRNGWKVSWQWSRVRNDLKKGKAMALVGKKSFKEKQGFCCSSQESMSKKYQPKVFEDIAGHEMTIKAISNAAKQKKVSHIYLFHGAGGTGKMSTARIFSMALNCESSTQIKPCWSCSGCSRSLYIMELCSGSRITGFRRISTLLQTTSFTQAVPGYKVLIVEECHLLSTEAWDELLEVVQGRYGSSVIFVLITSDANMVPAKISSRCQKFYFPKLKDSDITSKLVRIAAQEGIGIEREALRLVSAKSEGSLREAENILDQLTLLGPRISTSMVQQMVGLVPEGKLADLLVAVISGDVKKTIRLTKEQIATGIEARALVSQLASLITEILSNAAVGAAEPSTPAGSSRDKSLHKSAASQDSQLSNTHSEQLCRALKILVDMEKQSSMDQNALVFATLLRIASLDIPDRESPDMTSNSDRKENTEPVEMHQSRLVHSGSRSSRHSMSKTSEQHNNDRNSASASKNTEESNRCRGKAVERGEPNMSGMGEVEEIWLNILQRVRNGRMREFLCTKVKLASLTVSRDNAIVHLIFKKPEDKLAAQVSEESISKVLKKAIGYPVMVNMSLEPIDMGIQDRSPVIEYLNSRRHQETLFHYECVHNPTPQARKQMHYKHQKQSSKSDIEMLRTNDFKDSSVGHEAPFSQQMFHLAGFLTEEKQLDASEEPRTKHSARDTAHNTRNKMPKHRWVSLSSIQQSDASVERYSQDILFENENVEKEGRGRKHIKLHRSLSKACEDNGAHSNAKTIGLYRSWSCKEMLCQRKKKVTNHAL